MPLIDKDLLYGYTLGHNDHERTFQMNLLNKMERRLGRYAIPNLMIWLIGASALGYLILQFNSDLFQYLILSPYFILRGQVWRIFTWILVPTYSNLFSLLIMSLLYYQLGSVLERSLGAFRFNVYIFSGMIFTIVGEFVLYGIQYLVYGGVTMGMVTGGYQVSMNYIYLSIFLAFATLYPDMQVLLMFLIPVKMKWMAFVYAIMALSDFINTGGAGRVSIAVSFVNFLIFFLQVKDARRFSPHEMKRKKVYRTQMKSPSPEKGVARHKCAVCGRTELDDPTLEFRYCSRCEGNYEYCGEHLFTHEHKRSV
jgi:hypothetical protein